MTPLRRQISLIFFVAIVWVLQSCGSSGSSISAGDNFCMDLDDDGYTGFYTFEDGDDASKLPFVTCGDTYDCDDEDDQVYPDAIEVANNGIDEDCSGADYLTLSASGDDDDDDDDDTDPDACDDGSTTVTYYQDTDADGYGDPDVSQTTCEIPTGYSTLNTDCDDTNAAVYPGATEVAGDGVDQECDGSDDTSTCETSTSYFVDADGDGERGTTAISACTRPASNYYTSAETEVDCNDTNKFANHAMSGKDYGYLVYQDDPSESARIIPAAVKAEWLAFMPSRDGVLTRADFSQTSLTLSYYTINELGLPQPRFGTGTVSAKFLNTDNDCDGYFDEDGNTDENNSDVIQNYIENDDKADGHYPGVYYNVCNGVGAINFYDDLDGDGYGRQTDTSPEYACRDAAPSGQVASNDDCNDSSNLINPGITKDYANVDGLTGAYANKDNDCDGETDEDGTQESDLWLVTAGFNGFNLSDVNEKDKNTISLYSYIDSSTLAASDGKPPAQMTFDTRDGMGFKGSSSGLGLDSYDTSSDTGTTYYQALRVNSAYARFWYNEFTFASYAIDADLTDSASLDFSAVDCNASNGFCDGNITIDLTQPDVLSSSAMATDYLVGKRAVIFLRGIYYTYYDDSDEFGDAATYIKIIDSDISDSGKIQAHFSTNYNGPDKLNYQAKILFTVMVYDPHYIAIEDYGKADDTFSNDTHNNRYLNQENFYDFENDSDAEAKLYQYEAASEFSCSDESDCKDQKRTIGNLLYSWGFNVDESLNVNKVKAISYVSNLSNNTTGSFARIKTNGAAYNKDSDTKKDPNEMGSYLMVCANSDVCETIFSYTTDNSISVDF